MPCDGGRVVQRRQFRQLVELGDHRVVQQSRPVKLPAAVHYSMTDRNQTAVLQIDAVLGQLIERAA